MKKLYLVVITSIILAGCKVGVEATVNSDDLLREVHQESWAAVDVEVAACGDFEDSRKPSRSLKKAYEVVLSTFENAKYLECYQQNFNSYARFAIPMSVGHMSLEGGIQTQGPADIHIVSNDHIYLGVVIAPESLERMKLAQRRNYQSFDLSFSITLNKGEKPIPELFVVGSYISNEYFSDKPIAISKVNIASDTLTIKLSDVTNTIISEGGIGPILFTKEAIADMLNN